MHIEYKPLSNVPTAETLGDSDTILVVSGGEVKKTAKSNVGGGSGGGGGMLVETEFVSLGVYDKGFVTEDDADDIVEAFTSGIPVVVHFPYDESYAGYGNVECWMTIVGYAPEDNDEHEVIEFAGNSMGSSLVSWYNQLTRTESGKFFFKIYID